MATKTNNKSKKIGYRCKTCGEKCSSPHGLGKHYQENPSCTPAYLVHDRKYRKKKKKATKAKSNSQPNTPTSRTPQSRVNFCPCCGFDISKLVAIEDLM